MNKIFYSNYAKLYDLFYSEKDYKSECEFILESIIRFYSKKDKLAIIDFGCGTGEHSLILSKKGHFCRGIDLSEDMINLAMNKSKLNSKLELDFLVGDIKSYKSDLKFDIALMMFSVVGYLKSNKDLVSAFLNIRGNLKKGGLLIFDYWNGNSVLSYPPKQNFKTFNKDEFEVIRMSTPQNNLDEQSTKIEFRTILKSESKIISDFTESHQVRFYFSNELSFALNNSNFEILNISKFPNLDEKLDSNSWYGSIVARAI
jgi:SAM-dependent methyltransferase